MMSSFSSSSRTTNVSPLPSFREHTRGYFRIISSESGCVIHNQGQISETEMSLMDIPEVVCTHLHHLMPVHMEAEVVLLEEPDVTSHPATVMIRDFSRSTAISPLAATQVIDLSTDEHIQVMQDEKTPPPGDVSGCVLAGVIDEDSPNQSHTTSRKCALKRSRSSFRVCLEKRFDAMNADTPTQQDIQSPDPINFLTNLQSAEIQETVIQTQSLMNLDRTKPLEAFSSFVELIGNSPHMVGAQHQNFTLNFCPERKEDFTSSNSSTDEQQLVNTETTSTASYGKRSSTHNCQSIKSAAPGSSEESRSSSTKRARSHVSHSQRREEHNSRERDRRKRIRSCCDELNMLVPFCNQDSDKATTLQWTTAFLRYIYKTHGDTFKEDFKKAFAHEDELPPVQIIFRPEQNPPMMRP